MDDDEKETVADIVKNETARQAIILIFSIASSVAMVWVMRSVSSPDAFRTVKMKAALRAKRFAIRQADWWQARADDCATLYNRERY